MADSTMRNRPRVRLHTGCTLALLLAIGAGESELAAQSVAARGLATWPSDAGRVMGVQGRFQFGRIPLVLSGSIQRGGERVAWSGGGCERAVLCGAPLYSGYARHETDLRTLTVGYAIAFGNEPWRIRATPQAGELWVRSTWDPALAGTGSESRTSLSVVGLELAVVHPLAAGSPVSLVAGAHGMVAAPWVDHASARALTSAADRFHTVGFLAGLEYTFR